MFPQVQSSRYANSSLPNEFFSQHFIIAPSTEYIVPLPVLVSPQCKHTCIHIFTRDKLASIYMGRLINPRSIFKDIYQAVSFLVSKGLPFTFDNLVKASAFVATEDIQVPIGVILFLPEERGVVYRFILESYVAAMYDLIYLLYSHRCIEALLDLRADIIEPTRMILRFDQGIV